MVTSSTDLNSKAATFSPNTNFKFHVILQQIKEIHLGIQLQDDISITRNKNNLYFIVVIAVLFLVCTLTIYLNLSLTDLTGASKVLGIVHTITGSETSFQSLLASMLVTFVFSVPLTSILVHFGIRGLNEYMEINLYSLSGNFNIIFLSVTLIYLGFTGFCLLIAQFIITSKKLITSFEKSSLSYIKGLKVKQTLLVFQLSFSMIMIGFIVVIIDQFDHIENSELGLEDQNVMVIEMPVVTYLEGLRGFKELLKTNPAVKMVSQSTFDPTRKVKDYFEIETNFGLQKGVFDFEYWGFDYKTLMEIQLKEGSYFDGKKTSEISYLVNEKAVSAFGWDEPIGMKIKSDEGEGYVVGVVKDFRTTSFHSDVKPLIILPLRSNNWAEYTFVKLNPLRSQESIQEIEKLYYSLYEGTNMKWSFLDDRLRNLYRQDFQIRDISKAGLIISLIVTGFSVFIVSTLILMSRLKENSIRRIVGAGRADLFIRHINGFFKYLFIAFVFAIPIIVLLGRLWLAEFSSQTGLEWWFFITPVPVCATVVLLTAGVHSLISYRNNLLETLKEV